MVTVELGGDDGVVIEWPQRRVAKAVVEALDLFLGQRNRTLLDSVVLEGLWRYAYIPRPANPGSIDFLKDRFESPDQAPRARHPLLSVP
jgi:hypothetical protein